MTLKKLVLKAGVNRENTRYTNENGWYDSEKIRFRQGTPEKIGGWQRISSSTYQGICRSLLSWTTLKQQNLTGVGTNLKFYIENGANYYDVTPLRATSSLTSPFATNTTTNSGGYTTVTVTDAAGGYGIGDFVTFSNVTSFAGITTLNGEYQIVSFPSATTYTIQVLGTASASTTGGGTPVHAYYQVRSGSSVAVPSSGWGAGGWGSGTWGVGSTSNDPLRVWSQANFGEDLLFGHNSGAMYYWNASLGIISTGATVTIATPAVLTTTVGLAEGDTVVLTTTGTLPTGLTTGTIYYAKSVTGNTCNLSATFGGVAINTSGTQTGVQSLSARGVPVSSLAYANAVPLVQNFILVSDVSQFVFAFGATEYGSTVQDPMLISWSNQGSIVEWQPMATNQAGFLRLSHGSKIVTAIQSRQEIVVLTDSSVYSMHYVGAPVVWSATLVGDNISIAGQNAVAYSNGVTYWMGLDKFYMYDGRTNVLPCDLRQYVYSDVNLGQSNQFFASTNEGFNEVWFFYVSQSGANGTGSAVNPNTVVDKYVVYNYLEKIWYYGTMGRTAWLDSGLAGYPLAATYSLNLVNHEYGTDDNETGIITPILASITSAEFDIDDGDHFAFVYRVLPDVNFTGSTSAAPQIIMTLLPMQNSGSGYNNPASVGGINYANITRSAVLPIEAFTGQIFTRVRGRQMAIRVESSALGVQWQLGSSRLDIRQDGRR